MNLNADIRFEEQSLLLGKLLAEKMVAKETIASLHEVEFKVFSQWGDDGIIQWLIHHVDIPYQTFVEFGVEDYREANTRFLLMNDNWSGMVMDSSLEYVKHIINDYYYWKHDLRVQAAFIDRENINDLLSKIPFDKHIGILHIDIDGNDYWIWKAISAVSPIIVILEYNSVFGCQRAITVPYCRFFNRTQAHYSNLFYGSSLAALCHLSDAKGYAFVGSNSAGNNAYFVRKDKMNDSLHEVDCASGFVTSKFRESRNREGMLTFLSESDRLKEIKGLLVYNVLSEQLEEL
ncbi:MAG: hypothetical protein JW795_02660 [Chitinivibrionales bacterium]|nr:hypothetical protein [Chitinivibrionales bacterium]